MMQDIYRFNQEGIDEGGKAYGHFECTGVRPSFMSRLESLGCDYLPCLPSTHMMKPKTMMFLIVAISAGVCVAALVGGIAIYIQGDDTSIAEDRLSTLTAKGGRGVSDKEATLLTRPLDETRNAIDELLSQFGNVQAFFDQADVRIAPAKSPAYAVPWLPLASSLRCSCHFQTAGTGHRHCPRNPPSLLALLQTQQADQQDQRTATRSLGTPVAIFAAGHSLGAGLGWWQAEMAAPISREFGRCFEEQEFRDWTRGSTRIDDSTRSQFGYRFFATAVTLQRQTGGDLAEIFGQDRTIGTLSLPSGWSNPSLDREGRLSGIVLLALHLAFSA